MVIHNITNFVLKQKVFEKNPKKYKNYPHLGGFIPCVSKVIKF